MSLKATITTRIAFVPRLLELSNDIEKNPGPPKIIKNGLIPPGTSTARSKVSVEQKAITFNGKVMATIIDDTLMPGATTDLDGLRVVVEKQAEVISSQRVEIESLRKQMEKNLQMTQDFQSEMSEIRRNWQNICDVRKLDDNPVGIASKLEALASAYNDIQDRLYEIDKSWKNNLMIYGVPCAENTEEDPIITEEKVKEVLGKKLYITREIPISRVSRINYGPDFRGHKPIQVCLVNYRDKEEILRKARLLKGSNIYISEDFSRKVREHRNELIKFMKEVKTRDPARRMVLRYDKLYVGNDIFFFNDRTGRVERFHQPLEGGIAASASLGNIILNETQSNYHDSTWLRRPRSRVGSRPGSRCNTPLSRQNSMSMEDFTVVESSQHLPRVNGMTTSARGRYPLPGSPQKSYSMNSMRQYDGPSSQQHHYYQQNGPPQYIRQGGGYNRQLSEGFTPVPNTPIPSPPLVHPHGQLQYQHPNNGDRDRDRHHGHFIPRSQSTYQSDSEDELASYERKVMSERLSNNGIGEAIRSDTGSNPSSPSKRVAFRDSPPQIHSINANDDSPDELLAIETDLKPKPASFPIIPAGHNSVFVQDPTPSTVASSALALQQKSIVRSGNGNTPMQASQPLPPIEYSAGTIQHPSNINPPKGYIFQPPYPTLDGGKHQAFPALNAPTTNTVQPYMNHNENESESNEGQHPTLEYHNGDGNQPNGSHRQKFIPMNHQSQGGVVKVAMIGEFSMSNFHQCN